MKEHNQKKKHKTVPKQHFEITPNFKGNIYARAIDEAGNVSEEYKSAGTILENNGKHSTTSSIHILQETQERNIIIMIFIWDCRQKIAIPGSEVFYMKPERSIPKKRLTMI